MEKFKTKKSLGQNFLQDQNILQKIIKTAKLEKSDSVLEIGPGQGALTDYLVEYSNLVESVEIDHRLIKYLEEKYQKYSNFFLLHKNFVETQEEDFKFLKSENKKVKVIANLPYYLTTPIILKCILELNFISEMYIMVQKEVAKRFTAEYKNKQYGSITVFLQTISEVKYEFTVSKNSFKPVPKIDSAIISLKRKDNIIQKLNLVNEYENFLKLCFRQKRKTLINNLVLNTSNISKIEIIKFLENYKYHEKIRPEEIKVNEYIDLFLNWQKFIGRM